MASVCRLIQNSYRIYIGSFKDSNEHSNFECAMSVADNSSKLFFIGMFRSANTAMRITWRREAIMMLLETRHSTRRFSVYTVGPAIH